MKQPATLIPFVLLLGLSTFAHGEPASSLTLTDRIAEASVGTPKTKPFIFDKAPDLVSLSAGGFATSTAFEDHFQPDWNETQTAWEVSTWRQNGTQMHPSRARTNEDGHLVLTILPGEPYRGGSLQTARQFGYGRWIARVKPSSVPGLLNSIFTKDWDDKTTPEPNDGTKGEVDIEFVTHTFGEGKGEVHLAIHLKDKHPLWHVDIPLDFNPSDSFREWGFDILPDRVVWHVDGKVLFTWMYTEEDYITPTYEFFFNAWTKERWLKGPPKEEAHYHIDWLKFYPLLNH